MNLIQVSKLLQRLQHRYEKYCFRGSHDSWAGCSSEDLSGGTEGVNTAYVFEPRIGIRTSREARALILVLVREERQKWESIIPLLVAYQEKIWKREEPVYVVLKVALQFLIDRGFNANSPIQAAIEGLLNYHPRSFLGNDLKLASEVLHRSEIKIRALQRSKVRSPGQPSRPKERAEPTHEWLPSWQQQFRREEVDSWEAEDDPIWEVLSPTEVALHFGR